jgi:WD40 repeat protein
LHQFRRLQNTAMALSISADGRRLAAVGPSTATVGGRRPALAAMFAAPRDRVVVWDLETGNPVRELEGADAEQVNAIALSGDGKGLLTCDGKRRVRWWDVDGGAVRQSLDEPDRQNINWKATVAVSRDGRWAAVGDAGASTDIALFDLESGQRAHSLAGHERGVRKMVFDRDGSRLTSAGADDTIRVWDVVTGQEVLSRPAPRGVVDVDFCGHGHRLCAVAVDGTVRTWSGE